MPSNERDPAQTDARLGSQLWLERDDSPERVEELVSRAAELGIGQLRIWLIWPWIQENGPTAEWDFSVFDSAFDSAARHGITIKATLTANSGPWWLGTPSMLHSHTLLLESAWNEAIEEYVHACVSRYANHAALGQWILWNEPYYADQVGREAAFRPNYAGPIWAEILREKFQDDIALLNRRWRTGYATFEEVQYPEEIPHPAHQGEAWRSFSPALAEVDLRAALLEENLRRIANLVRRDDSTTPLCINPNQTLFNNAEYGYKLERLADIVDVLGASFHAPWSFDFAPTLDNTPLVVAGLKYLSHTPGSHSSEVTEVQTGNTFYAGLNPGGVTPDILAATYLAPLLAGAESVTGWCLNSRSMDFEAGEWGMLDDLDRIGTRALAVTRVKQALSELDREIGVWHPTETEALVLVSDVAQAVSYAIGSNSQNDRGADSATSPRGPAVLTTMLGQLGVNAALAPMSAVALQNSAQLFIASHVVAWTETDVDSLLLRAHEGATVLVDATTGEFDFESRLQRPWPGHFAGRTGIRSVGLETAALRSTDYDVLENGYSAGSVSGVRSAIEITDPAWHRLGNLAYQHDGKAVLWQRKWGQGRLIYCTAALSPSVLRFSVDRGATAQILDAAASEIAIEARVTNGGATILPVTGDRGAAVGIFAPATDLRDGRRLGLDLRPGRYRDLWSQADHEVDSTGHLELFSSDGIALLVRRNNQ